jgi:hypothetical protein
MTNATESHRSDRTIVRLLAALIAGVVLVVILLAVFVFNNASDRGKARADDRIACAHANIASATTRRC